MTRSIIHRVDPIILIALSVVLLFLHNGYGSSDEAPQLLKGNVKDGYLELDSRYEIISSEKGGTLSYEDKLLEIRPKVGLDFEGSLYHPSLFDYDLSVILGQSFEREVQNVPGRPEPRQSREDTNPLQFYNGKALILKDKKLSGSVFGSYNLIRLDNGFFSRRLLYQEGYGTKLNYAGDVLPWQITAQHRADEETETPTPRDSMEDEFNFKASNSREGRGETTIDYLYQDFARQDFNVAQYTGTRNTLLMNDFSHFFDDKLNLGSYLYYNDIESATVPSSLFSLRERLTAEHTEDLRSIYEYNYDTRNSGRTDSVQHKGSISLKHQLYDSLASTASSEVLDTSQTSLDTFRYGVSIDESYSKHVGDSSMLNLGFTLKRRAEDRQASGGDTIDISNEQHVLTTGVLTFLNQPNVILSSVQVTDITGTILYSRYTDYDLTPLGNVTQIDRIITGNIPQGGTVLVSYSIINPGTGSFTTQEGYYRFRYSVFDSLLSFYGHLRVIENNGGDQFILEDLKETVLGLETRWNWFNAGVEYENYDSSLIPTETIRLFENFTFGISPRSTLNLSADQSAIIYKNTDEEIRRYFHNITYRAQLTSQLTAQVGGQLYLQRGKMDPTLDRDLLAANAELDYRIGKTFIRASYEYRDEDYLNEVRLRNTTYLSVRRVF